MKKKIISITIVLLIVLSMVLISCAKQASTTSTPAAPSSQTSTQVSTTQLSTQANWWDKFGIPQYGGTIIHRTQNLEGVAFDPTSATVQAKAVYWLETLFAPDWTLNRNTWSFKIGWAPTDYYEGALAKNWEQTDPTTILIHLRQGVHWQNKPPTNGREFTADDVVYNFDRILGTGDGYTHPNPALGATWANFQKATALDRYTVQIKLKQPSLFSVIQLVTGGFAMQAKEWLELGGFVDNPASGGPPGGGPPGGAPPGGAPPGGTTSGTTTGSEVTPTPTAGGPLTDWHNVTGTGPWILSDMVMGSSMTFSKNPNYWGTDERYPQNKLPYADTLKEVAIPDMQTSLAAIRTGKVDIVADKDGPSWQQKKSLNQTNPDLQWAQWPMEGWSLAFRTDTAPFNDIRVRTALQMAVNTKAIAASIYGGTIDGTPVGLNNPVLKGWAVPFSEWPQNLQQEYTYNPSGAKKLLAEAGFTNGFSTHVTAPSSFPLDLLEVIKSEFQDIGVQLEIRPVDMSVFIQMMMSGKNDSMVMDQACALVGSPLANLQKMQGGFMMNFTNNNDKTYDDMYNQLNVSTSEADAEALCQKMELYALSKHWTLNTFSTVTNVVWQPYLKGYSGEANVGEFYFARMWIDQAQKQSMGR